MMNFNKIFLLTLAATFLLSAGVVSAQQDAEPQMGIEEQLGQLVPMNISFTDADGKSVMMRDLMGKPTLLTLVYFSCPHICDPLLRELGDTLALVKDEPGKDFNVLSVSFDPADTVALANEKKAINIGRVPREMSGKSWRFLVGKQESIDALTRAVGFHYSERDGQFDHAGTVVVLSPEGKIVRYIQGSAFQPADFQLALNEAKSGRVGATRPLSMAPISGASKLLAFCFPRDAKTMKYVPAVNRLAASATILTAGTFLAFLIFGKGKRKKQEASDDDNN